RPAPPHHNPRAVDGDGAGSRAGAGGPRRRARERRAAARGAAATPTDEFRSRDAPRDRYVPRRRELLAASCPAACGEPAVDPTRLLPAGLPRVHRRVAHLAAPGAWHVRWRPLTEGDPRRVRLPAAERARSPP